MAFVKTLVGAFNQEKALVGAFSVIVKPVVEPMDHFTALLSNHSWAGGERQCMERIRSSDSTPPCLLLCRWSVSLNLR